MFVFVWVYMCGVYADMYVCGVCVFLWLYVHKCVNVYYVHVRESVWKSEDNLEESFLSIYPVVRRPESQDHHLQSHLTDSEILIF